jgi:hypothetical protein
MIIKRAMMSVNPAIANSAAAIKKNNLELAERSGLFRKPTASRMTHKIPATANNIGQSGFRWLAILQAERYQEYLSLQAQMCRNV